MPVLPDLILQGPLLDPQLHTKLAAWFSEEGILRQKGFSTRVVHTLLCSGKEVTRGILREGVEGFYSWFARVGFDSHDSPSMLDFLQDGEDKGL